MFEFRPLIPTLLHVYLKHDYINQKHFRTAIEIQVLFMFYIYHLLSFYIPLQMMIIKKYKSISGFSQKLHRIFL